MGRHRIIALIVAMEEMIGIMRVKIIMRNDWLRLEIISKYYIDDINPTNYINSIIILLLALKSYK